MTPEASQVAAQLDGNHAPETNGRMAVCRRCGARTDSPSGQHHVLAERDVARSVEWLTADVHRRRAQRLRDLRRH